MAKIPHNPLESERSELVIDLSGDKLDELISIIIVHHNKPEYLNICLQSIAVCSVNNNFEIIVVDNGSDQETQDFLDAIDDGSVKIVRNDRNLYLTKAMNQGIKAADKNSSYFVILHADCCVINHTWLDLLIGVSESSDSGMVGAQMSAYTMENQKIDFIQDWCVLLTRKCWEEVGPFNESLPQIGAAFLFTLSAQAKNHKPRCVKVPIVHHYHISGLDINLYENFAERAAVEIPVQMRKMPELSSLVKLG